MIQHFGRRMSFAVDWDSLRGEECEGKQGQTRGRRLNLIPALIGRRRELNVLVQSLQESVSGQPKMFLIQGDSGVGKTRLLKEFCSIASLTGARVCYGRYFEESALTYPLFIETLLSGLLRAAEEVGPDLEAEATILRELLSGNRAPQIFRSAVTRPDQDRLGVFFSITRTAIKIAQYCPLVLAIDDLQWADQLSLELLTHLMFAVADAAERSSAPFFILGAFRPVHPQDRLSLPLIRFQREEMCQTLELVGLGVHEVYEFVKALGVERPAWQLVEAIHKATQGNPLFIQEVLLQLIAQDRLQKRSGFYVMRTSLEELNLPTHVTTAIKGRIQHLSGACRKLLAFAAVLGERFSFHLLQEASTSEDTVLLDLLEEGLQQHVLISQGSDFFFAHPMIRAVFYQELSLPRRQRYHLQAALTLAHRHEQDEDPLILEIAHHFICAGTEAEAETVACYTRQAGKLAFERSAWGEAARFYEAAIAAITSSSESLLHDRAELHRLAGLAHYRNMDAGPALEQYEKAIACFQLTDDICGLGWALADKIHIYFTLASVPYGTLIDLNPLENTVEKLGDSEIGLQGHLWATIAKSYWTARLPERTEPAARRALELGRRSNDSVLCAESHLALALSHSQNLQLREELESWNNSLQSAQQAHDAWRQGLALQRIPMPLIGLGRLKEAEEVALEACQAIQETHDWGGYSMALALLVFIDVAKGDFTSAEKHAEETLRMADRSRYPWGAALALPSLACLRAMRGDFDEADQALTLLVEPDCFFSEPGPAMQMLTWMYRQMLKARFSEIDSAWELCAKELLKVGGNDVHALAGYCAVVELSETHALPEMAEAAYDALFPAVQREIVFSSGWVFLLSRILGVAATLNQWWGKAEVHFQDALEKAHDLNARPELGRTYLDYARMLRTRGESGDCGHALDCAEHSLAIFQDLGMLPFIQQALQLIECLQHEGEVVAIADARLISLPAEQTVTAPALNSAQDDGGNVFLREGDFWTLTYQGETCHLKDTKGLHYLTILLRSPGREIHARELLSLVSSGESKGDMIAYSALQEQELCTQGLRIGDADDGVWLLDSQAKAEYKRRLNELREEQEEAVRFNDPTRVEKIQQEIEFLARELTSALGLGGRNRKEASVAERARLSVTKAIKTALRHISDNNPTLGQHLTVTVRTGTFCAYLPDPTRPIIWTC